MSYTPLKEGDKVIMHTCMEGDMKNDGKIWTVSHDEFTRAHAKSPVCFLEGFSGSFACHFLQKVNLKEDQS